MRIETVRNAVFLPLFLAAAAQVVGAQTTTEAPRNIIVGEPPSVVVKATGEIGANNVAWQKLPDGTWRATYAANVEYPGLRFDAGKAYSSTEWSGVGALAVDLRNVEIEPIDVLIRVDDSAQADGNRHSSTGTAHLAPGERATVLFPLASAAPGMRSGPPLPVMRPRTLSNVYGDTLESSHIVSFQLFMGRADKPRSIDLYSVKWLPKQDLNEMVDRFGQYSRADWPGKVRSEAELATRAAQERAWLASHPADTNRDEYGGWKNGPQLKASGFFRTALVRAGKEISAANVNAALPAGARWWLVTPSGHLFWSAGVDVVNGESGGPIGGRETLFSELPTGARESGNADFYRWNLNRKYGAEAEKQWQELALSRLKSWGFNTIGNWSREVLFRARRVPYTVALGTPGEQLATLGNFGLPDYFDSRFPDVLRKSLTQGVSEWKSDPWCVGYFVDNKIKWDNYSGGGAAQVLAAAALGASAESGSHRAFAAILRDKYQTPQAWSRAWGISATSFETPLALEASRFNAAASADASLFLAVLTRRYYSTVRDVLHEVAPNQLYLGSRLASRPTEAVQSAAQFCDVVSFNIYQENLSSKDLDFLNTLGKPTLIGEFHFGALDRGMFSGGLVPRASQAERAQSYEKYVQSALARPGVVGAHWFQYIDEPLTGRFDGENYNIGLVDVTDTPYPELRDAARRVHSSIYALRKGAGAG